MFGNVFKSKEEKALEKILNDKDNLKRYGPKVTLSDMDDNKEHAMKLKSIYDNSDNDELVNFINSPDAVGDFDALFTKMSKANLSTIVEIAPNATKQPICDGVSLVQNRFSNKLNPDNIEELNQNPSLLPLAFRRGEKLGFGVFTNKKSLEITLNQQKDPSILYPQLVPLDYLVFFSLIAMDGLIVIDDGAGFFIPKNILMNHFDKIQSSCKNHKLNELNHVLFVFDE